MSKHHRVAIVGAGISGLSCAKTLQQKDGFDVTIFDKSRGTGGRLSTRRVQNLTNLNDSHNKNNTNNDSSINYSLQFDHGAQYFTVRNEQFRNFVNDCISGGAAAEWKGRIATLGQRPSQLKDGGSLSNVSSSSSSSSSSQNSNHSSSSSSKNSTHSRYVGTPGMSSLAKYLAISNELQSRIHHNVNIQSLVYQSEEGRSSSSSSSSRMEWKLKNNQGETVGVFDRVVMAIPAPQASSLLESSWPEASSRITSECRMAGCWTTMLAFPEPLDLPFDAAFVNNSPVLSWIARNSSKPQRVSSQSEHGMDCWILHAGPEWSDANIERTKEDVEPDMIQAFRKALGSDAEKIPSTPAYTSTHRWRYASVPQPLNDPYLLDAKRGIGVCGDWCGGPRVEGAFLSGLRLAEAIIEGAKNKSSLNE